MYMQRQIVVVDDHGVRRAFQRHVQRALALLRGRRSSSKPAARQVQLGGAVAEHRAGAEVAGAPALGGLQQLGNRGGDQPAAEQCRDRERRGESRNDQPRPVRRASAAASVYAMSRSSAIPDHQAAAGRARRRNRAEPNLTIKASHVGDANGAPLEC